jgi:hypothetical protein
VPPPGVVMQDSLPFNPFAIQRRVATMVWRWLSLIILAAALPARADDLVSTTQVVAAQVAGALAAGPLGNVSVIYQSGSGNVGRPTRPAPVATPRSSRLATTTPH